MEAALRIETSSRLPAALPAPRVFVVDDDVSVRESLELLLEEAGWEVSTFVCAADFLACPKGPGASCLVLDMSLPGLSGLDLQDRLTAEGARMPIVFISGNVDIPMTVRAIRGGAMELLTKPLRDDALLAAIGRALEHSREQQSREADLAHMRERLESLTPRESEVLALVVAGLLNKQAAAELGISEITVKAHRGAMMRKMMARSLPDLVKMAAALCVPAWAGTAQGRSATNSPTSSLQNRDQGGASGSLASTGFPRSPVASHSRPCPSVANLVR